MKLVIDIPQTMIDELREGCFGAKHNVYELAGLIMDGTVLGQESKSDEDCISRKKAIRMLRREIECMAHSKCQDCILEKVCDPAQLPTNDEYIEAFEMAIKALEQEPKTGKDNNVTTKTGHWIMHIDDLFPAESTMECSECGEHQPIIIDDNYCPNCGRRMKGEIE